MVVILRSPENLERDQPTIVPALPNFGLLGDGLGMVTPLRDDACKLI